MLESKIIFFKYILLCKLLLLIPFFSHAGKQDKSKDIFNTHDFPDKKKKEEKKIMGPLKIEYFKDHLIIKDIKNKTLRYNYNDTSIVYLHNVKYHSSDPTKKWHLFKVTYWSHAHHISEDGKLIEFPEEKYEIKKGIRFFINSKDVVKKESTSYIYLENHYRKFDPVKIRSCLLLNFEDKLQFKVDREKMKDYFSNDRDQMDNYLNMSKFIDHLGLNTN